MFSGGEDEAGCGICKKDERFCIVQGVRTCLSADFLCDGQTDCSDGLVSGSHVWALLWGPSSLRQLSSLLLVLHHHHWHYNLKWTLASLRIPHHPFQSLASILTHLAFLKIFSINVLWQDKVVNTLPNPRLGGPGVRTYARRGGLAISTSTAELKILTSWPTLVGPWGLPF